MAQSRIASIVRLLLLPQRWVYRVSQFVRGVLAHVTPDEMLAVTETLPRPAVALFVEMPLDAQRHSLNVLYYLRKQAERANTDLHPSLAAAGLLHDVGKIAADEAGRGIQLWLRGPLVLLEALAPQRMAGYANPDPESGWRYTLHVHLDHPAIGAKMAAQAGCDPLACWLIAHHQEAPESLRRAAGDNPAAQDPFVNNEQALALLSALRRADQRN